MKVGFKLISKDYTGILSLDDAKDHLRIPREDDTQDDLIQAYIESAIDTAEDETERKISVTTYDFKIPAERMSFYLPYDEFREISQVTFKPGNPVVEFDDYVDVDDFQSPAYVTVKDFPEGTTDIIIRVVFGTTVLPKSIIQGIKMVLAHYYDNNLEVEVGRTANQVPMGAKRIFEMNRFYRF